MSNKEPEFILGTPISEEFQKYLDWIQRLRDEYERQVIEACRIPEGLISGFNKGTKIDGSE